VAEYSDVYDVVQAVMLAVEPDVLIAKDPALARPVDYAPNTLYGYPTLERHTRIESGPGVRQDFTMLLDLALDDMGEQAAGLRDPLVTARLRIKAKAYAEWTRANQRSTDYDQLLMAEIDWQALNGIGYRGFRMRLTGYRLVG